MSSSTIPSTSAASSSSSFYSRRTLHVPFFPVESPPPSQPPTATPFPKYPSSSSSATPQTFFPFYPSPPLPSLSSSSNQPTFPANISSLAYPQSSSAQSSSAASNRRSSHLLPAVLVPLLAVAFLSVAAGFFLYRRHRRPIAGQLSSDKDEARSDSHRLVPPGSAHSDGSRPKQGSPLSQSLSSSVPGFLTRGGGCVSSDDDYRQRGSNSAVGSPYQRLDSPELRPLPPLSTRQARRGRGKAEISSEEEFYSPTESAAEKGSARGVGGAGGGGGARLSSSRRTFRTITTPSYPSSPSPTSSAVLSSPAHLGSSRMHSIRRSFKSRSERSLVGDLELEYLSPQPPPAVALLRPLTPSPPRRKPHSSSPHSSVEKESESPIRTTDFAPRTKSPQRQAQPPSPPPPPPPPPPPVGYWETQVRKWPARGPPKQIGFKSSSEVVYPEDSPKSSFEATPRDEETPPPKLKPLHWDKVRASSDRAMVWDQLKSSSFKVDEEMIQTLFVCNTTNAATMEAKKWQVFPSAVQENRVLDPKKSQNIAILLRALNVTKEEVCEALLEGTTDSLGSELLETLLKMAPSKEEELKLKEYRDDSPFKLGPAEKFLKALLDIPFAFKRVDAMLYMANFDSEAKYLDESFETLEEACEELRNSRLFLKLLEAVLKTGNRMNIGTNRGDAHAFKLDTLLTLVDVKGTDGKTTLLHFVVQEISRAEGSRLSASNPLPAKTQSNSLREDLEFKKLGLQVVAGLGNELINVKKAAAMDSDVLSSYVTKLAGGVQKINEVLRLNQTSGLEGNDHRFGDAMQRFLKRAEDQILKVQAHESVALSLVKEITEYFHGDSAKEEAHPFRIFMVVRDFLAILDRVCKEVGKVIDQTIASSERHFPVPVNPTLPPVFPKFQSLRPESSDDEDESSLSS